jgi:hypothetical protein
MRKKITAVLLAGAFALSIPAAAAASPTVLPGSNDEPGNSDCHGHNSDVNHGLDKKFCS